MLELLTVHEGVVLDADLKGEGRAVPASAYLLVYFAHAPGELLFFEIWEVFGDHPQENLTDLFQFLGVVFAVELKGVVHDVAVVEGGHRNRSMLHGFDINNSKIKFKSVV